jgi:2-C-methyl-D-erythritol 4-phosphate cytidylyltransferase
MNIAVIFAGGVGKRMGNEDLPKQFIEIDSKPILVHTIEQFEKNKNIDVIIVSIVNDWLEHTLDLVQQYSLTKVKHVIPGGETGQMSIFNGIKCAKEHYLDDTIVLIHDGVRPFITQKLIDDNIETTRKYGSAISSVGAIETFLVTDIDSKVVSIPKRSQSMIAKAPQSFLLKDIYDVHIQAQKDGIFNSIDSCTLMNSYNRPLSIVITDHNNIKITTPKDIVIAKSIYEKLWR